MKRYAEAILIILAWLAIGCALAWGAAPAMPDDSGKLSAARKFSAPKAPPEILGPSQIEPYRFIDLSLSGQWESVLWRIKPAPSDRRDSGTSVLWIGPPKAYTVEAWAISWQRKEQAIAEAVVTIGTPGPTPPIPPDPPGPTPAKFSHAYLIYDEQDASPAFATLRTDKAWKDEAKRLGIEVEILTDLDGTKAYPNATKAAIAKGLPALVLFNDGQPPVVEAAPATPAAMLERIRKAGGQ